MYSLGLYCSLSIYNIAYHCYLFIHTYTHSYIMLCYHCGIVLHYVIFLNSSLMENSPNHSVVNHSLNGFIIWYPGVEIKEVLWLFPMANVYIINHCLWHYGKAASFYIHPDLFSLLEWNIFSRVNVLYENIVELSDF